MSDTFRRSRDEAAAMVRRSSTRPSWDDPVERAIEALRDDAGADAAAEARTARSWQRRTQEQSATWLGSLLDAAEAGDQVMLTTDLGTTLVGVVESVGRDVVVLRNGDDRTLCATDTLTTVRSAHRASTARGDRQVSNSDLRSLLDDYAERRSAVLVQLRGGAAALITGVIASCGEDVCSIEVRMTGVPGRASTVHVRLGAIATVLVNRTQG